VTDSRRIMATVLIALLLAPAGAAPQTTTVPRPVDVARPPLAPSSGLSHLAPDCMLSEAHPLIEATSEPSANISSARVYYRSSRTSDYAIAEMTRRGDVWQACLAAPADQTASVIYYLATSTRGEPEQRTGDFAAMVAHDAGQCADRRMAAIVDCAVAAAPPGFLTAGQIAGGGISKAYWIVGGAAALGLIGVIVRNDKDPKSGSR
jgi:hypothetical protein